MNLTQLDPCGDGIRPHDCIKHIPQWPDNSARMTALRRDVQTTGVREPIQMTAKHEIVDADSRERWRAARMLQLEKIPVAIVEDDLVNLTSLQLLIQRRHLTKSAIAYLAFPQLENALDEARDRRMKWLKTHEKASISNSPLAGLPKNVAELAEIYGMARTTIFEAQKVHALFAKDAAFKAQMEPRILAEPIGGEHEQHRPVGLGAVIAGYAGKQNEDKPRNDGSQLELFGKAVKSFCFRAPDDESAARKVVRAEFEKLSPEELEPVMKTVAIMASELKALAKGAAR